MITAIHKPETKISLVLNELRTFISQATPGTALPPIRSLEKTLGVSRITLSSAISVLKNEGVIAARQGSGCYINDPPKKKSSKKLVKTDVIGLIFPELYITASADIEKQHLAMYIEGLQSVLPHSNFRCLTLHDAELPAGAKAENAHAVLSGCDVCIVFKAARFSPRVTSFIRQYGKLMIGTGSALNETAIIAHDFDYCILRDIRPAIREIFNRFYALGHRRTGFVFQNPQETAFLEPYYREIFGTPLPQEYCVYTMDAYGGYDFSVIQPFLENNPKITAYFLFDQYTSSYFFQACAAEGLRIPQDISTAALFGPYDFGSVSITSSDTAASNFKIGFTAGRIISLYRNTKNLFEKNYPGIVIQKTNYIDEILAGGNSINSINPKIKNNFPGQ